MAGIGTRKKTQVPLTHVKEYGGWDESIGLWGYGIDRRSSKGGVQPGHTDTDSESWGQARRAASFMGPRSGRVWVAALRQVACLRPVIRGFEGSSV